MLRYCYLPRGFSSCVIIATHRNWFGNLSSEDKNFETHELPRILFEKRAEDASSGKTILC